MEYDTKNQHYIMKLNNVTESNESTAHVALNHKICLVNFWMPVLSHPAGQYRKLALNISERMLHISALTGW